MLNKKNPYNLPLVLFATLVMSFVQFVQTIPAQTNLKSDPASKLYLDMQNGMTADQAVALALEIQLVEKDISVIEDAAVATGFGGTVKISPLSNSE